MYTTIAYLIRITIVPFSILTVSYGVRLTRFYDNFNDSITDSIIVEDSANNGADTDSLFSGYLSSPEECARPCTGGGDPKTCYYKFNLEEYSVFGRACDICTSNNPRECQCVYADGVERSAFTVNRMIPGPMIEVCQNDNVIIDVVNEISGSSVTIHWHGMLQRDTQFYDGVPYVTQCPILPGNTFRYKWQAKDAGTHFWHSHSGLQKMDGLAGPLIVRQSNDPHSSLYNFDNTEHVIFLQDWRHTYLNEQFPGSARNNNGHDPHNILINGKGQFLDPITNQFTNVPIEEFSVRKYFRYRFRLINAFASVCPVQITIENHKLTVITTDGHPIQPVTVDTIISTSAERFDFILYANNTGGTYWIHIKGLGNCERLKLHQVAMLKYEIIENDYQTPRPTYDTGFPRGKVLNPLDTNCAITRDDAVCISQLKNIDPVPKEITRTNATKIYLPFKIFTSTFQDFYKPNTYGKHFVLAGSRIATGLMDNIQFKPPPSPLLSQYRNLNTNDFCNGDELRNCSGPCECTHLIRVRLNTIVELILIDEVSSRTIHHPFHLHGFAFHVIAIGKMPFPGRKMTITEAIKLDQQNLLDRHYESPPLKDTIMVPSNGYAVIRFKANHQGFWFLHCHFLMHLITGMSAVLQVGSLQNMPKPPPNFPKCGNFL